ncbi:MAG: hypothetical protein Kow0074_16720 [Candidatus Zixiibacteriota bacterium]
MMARADTKTGGRARGAAPAAKGEGLPFTKKNYYLFLTALLVIVVGYLALAQGSITLAPILLVLGYCVIIPVAILYRGSDTSSTEETPTGS